MLKSILILCAYAAVFLCSEMLYRFVFDIPQFSAKQTAESFALIWTICAFFYFAKYRITRVAVFVFFMLSSVANNIHYTVYQSWITGINYWLMFKEAHEAGSAGLSMAAKLMPHALWGGAECLLFLSLSRLKRNSYAVFDWLFAALILLSAGRSFRTSQEFGISPKPAYSRIKSNYFSLGYFLGRILPYQAFNLSSIAEYSAPAPERVSDGMIRNVVFIMGESESAAHVGLFGYPRDTSPFMAEFARSDYHPLVRPVNSAALMTAVSLPYFFNAVPRPNGYTQINSGRTNLFRLAQEQGYQTHFYSTQAESEMAIMNLIGSRWIAHQTSPVNFGYGKTENIPDDKLLPQLAAVDLNQGKHFIVLHQRGSHVPYGSQLESKDKVFGNGGAVDEYDNTIRKTDELIKRVFGHMQAQNQRDWLLVYTSDHGQYVSQTVFNQGTAHADSYTVPLVLYSPDAAVQQLAERTFNGCQSAFHQQLSVMLIQTLGYKMPEPGCREGTVTGNLLTGDAGYIEIKNGKSQYVYPK